MVTTLDDDAGFMGVKGSASRSQLSDPSRKAAISWSLAEKTVEERICLVWAGWRDLVGVQGVGGGKGFFCFIGEGSGEGTAVQKESSRPCRSWLINAASSAIVYKGMPCLLLLGTYMSRRVDA